MPNIPMRIAHGTAGGAVRRWLRTEVRGLDHVPGEGGVILAANHVSNLDNYLLSAASPRPACFVGKAELAEGLFGRFNKAMGMVPVERGRADRTALDMVVALLRAGEVVGLFPEGTRSATGELFGFRSGMARIAAAAQAPVVPVGLRGTDLVWPRGQRARLRPPQAGTVAVHFGGLQAPPADTPRARRQFTQRVRAAVAELSGQPLATAMAPRGQG